MKPDGFSTPQFQIQIQPYDFHCNSNTALPAVNSLTARTTSINYTEMLKLFTIHFRFAALSLTFSIRIH